MSEKLFNVIGALLAVGAGFVAQKLISTTWRVVMSEDPPDNPEDPDTSFGEAISWALASGVVVAVVKLLANRQWTRYYINATGHRPGEKAVEADA